MTILETRANENYPRRHYWQEKGQMSLMCVGHVGVPFLREEMTKAMQEGRFGDATLAFNLDVIAAVQNHTATAVTQGLIATSDGRVYIPDISSARLPQALSEHVSQEFLVLQLMQHLKQQFGDDLGGISNINPAHKVLLVAQGFDQRLFVEPYRRSIGVKYMKSDGSESDIDPLSRALKTHFKPTVEKMRERYQDEAGAGERVSQRVQLQTVLEQTLLDLIPADRRR